MRLLLCCVLCLAVVTADHTGDLTALKQKPQSLSQEQAITDKEQQSLPQEQVLTDKGDSMAVEKGSADIQQDLVQQADPVTTATTAPPVTTQAPVVEPAIPPQNGALAQPIESQSTKTSKPQNHEPSLPSKTGTNNWLTELENRFVNPSSNQSATAAKAAFTNVLRKLDEEDNEEVVVPKPQGMSMGRIERTQSLVEEKLEEEVGQTRAPISAILSATEKMDMENAIGVDDFRKIDELNLENVPDLTRELSFKLILANTKMLLKQNACLKQNQQASTMNSPLESSNPVNPELSTPVSAKSSPSVNVGLSAPVNNDLIAPTNGEFSSIAVNDPIPTQSDTTTHDVNLNRLNTQSRAELESKLRSVLASSRNDIKPMRSQAMVNSNQKTVDLESLSIDELRRIALNSQTQRQSTQQQTRQPQTPQHNALDLNTLAFLYENEIPISVYNHFRRLNSPIVPSSQAPTVSPALRWHLLEAGYDLDDIYKMLYPHDTRQATFLMSRKNKAKKTKKLEKSGVPVIIERSLVPKTKKASKKE